MAIVVIEGIDGSGKDTQLELLRGIKPFAYFKYPTPGNKKIRAYLEKKEEIGASDLVNLFLDDIASEQGKVAAASAKGLVILDRYVFSTIAYEAHLVPYDEIKQRVLARGFIKPDKVLLLDLDSSTSQQRKSRQKKLDRYEENASYLEGVRQNFLRLYEERFFAGKWVKIDATKSIEDVHKAILGQLL